MFFLRYNKRSGNRQQFILAPFFKGTENGGQHIIAMHMFE